MKLKVASFNVHACIGSDGRFDPSRIADVIRELDADVLALQEVEHHKVDEQDLLEYLAAVFGYETIAGTTMQRETRAYGNALLTRLPILNTEIHDISVKPYEPRSLIKVQLMVGDKSLMVYATHLGLMPFERRLQVKHLLSLISKQSADVTVLLGDLNEWFLWGRPLRWLRQFFVKSPHIPSFPSAFPLFSLDRILVSPDSAMTSIGRHRTALSKQASDHLPISAQIEI
ncbi:endonuclease/exonuclease/phosphatase family protein [Methylophaga sp. OBS3]|uniref:endonuclease/exonuclease/phosphatase family protein n=1 Tax=Methylophaga sp. OBS3 TaxID=2991934 RepID=UPI002256BDEE|nr:endonuclease/exonuclease/phosphatase family protein [Methylophaga sp. OBS3]MCX4189655.1 endonuclease/exonuclease/phosphatase family protein [Methylophaga sp. OBS3]